MKDKKLKGRVIDFRHGSFIVLCFRGGDRVAVTTSSIEDYLIEVNSPYSWQQLYESKNFPLQVQTLTEFYRSDIISSSGKQIKKA